MDALAPGARGAVIAVQARPGAPYKPIGGTRVKRNPLLLSIIAAAVVLLSGCQVIFDDDPRPRTPDDHVRAANDPGDPVGTYTLRAGEDVLVRVIPNTSLPVLYLELNREIDLEVFRADRSLFASAGSSEFFGSGATGLTSAASVRPQALDPAVTCRGSCVILDQGTSSEYLALITNSSGATLSVDLYAFGDTMADLNESANDNFDTAPDLPAGGDSGAIEVLGDVDYWHVTGTGRYIFDAPSTNIEIVLDVYEGNRFVDTYVNGDTLDVIPGDLLVVRSANNRAGASSESAYSISPPN